MSWLSTAQLKFRKSWGEGAGFWLLHSNKDLSSKKQNSLSRSWNKHLKSRVTLDYCSELERAAAACTVRGDAQLSCRDGVSLCFFFPKPLQEDCGV